MYYYFVDRLSKICILYKIVVYHLFIFHDYFYLEFVIELKLLGYWLVSSFNPVIYAKGIIKLKLYLKL